MAKPTSLYRFYDQDERLLYVGVTSVPRWDGGHRRDKAWWEEVAVAKVEHFPERTTALTAERYAIQHEKPEYNVVHNSGNGRNGSGEVSQIQSTRYPLSEGDVVGVGMTGHDLALVGMVVHVDDLGFRMTLVDWVCGFFNRPDRWMPWRLVEMVVFADLMSREAIVSDGWNPEAVGKMYDLEPLSRFQSEWSKHIEKAKAPAE